MAFFPFTVILEISNYSSLCNLSAQV